MDRAKRRALNILDEWLDSTGALRDGYRDELEGVVEDAVHVGVQAALGVREPLESEEG
jgi:hypothetical protein